MKKNKIFQTGTINSLLQAVYYGDTSIGDLKEHGDFGLGTPDLVDGELIICDNICYRTDVNGKLTIAPDTVKSPFAVISHFKAEQTLNVANHTFASLEQFLEQKFTSKNLIYTIKITAKFKQITLRSESCQPRPFKKLAETMPEVQNVYSENDVSGTIVGVWFPKYLQQINVPGFHFHFVDDARQIGGHVFRLEIISGTVEIQTMTSLQMDLIENDMFYNADLNNIDENATAAVEKQR